MSVSTKATQAALEAVNYLETYINEEKTPDLNVVKIVTKDYIETARKFLSDPNYGGDSTDEEADAYSDNIAKSMTEIDTLNTDMKAKVELINSYIMGRLMVLSELGMEAIKSQEEDMKVQDEIEKTRNLVADLHVAIKEDTTAMAPVEAKK